MSRHTLPEKGSVWVREDHIVTVTGIAVDAGGRWVNYYTNGLATDAMGAGCARLDVFRAKYVQVADAPRTQIAEALAIAFKHGGYDGAHHKAWVIDRMVRALTGGEHYAAWIKGYEQDGEYEWERGVAA
ncbi:hypothetical protein [Micromonospora sp. NBC_01813]|uniref:hypothetical protein n=1 Tax=Micromonospora sp. NBC_01813 TaxID=2975988 RepID=UPI002DDA8B55|nr:hypothetical protein [Micromonospora sp. NBC_01813]WSA11505.1 hypothetical protein OG958_12405 [Micromonospora sp. NBC_01813]